MKNVTFEEFNKYSKEVKLSLLNSHGSYVFTNPPSDELQKFVINQWKNPEKIYQLFDFWVIEYFISSEGPTRGINVKAVSEKPHKYRISDGKTYIVNSHLDFLRLKKDYLSLLPNSFEKLKLYLIPCFTLLLYYFFPNFYIGLLNLLTVGTLIMCFTLPILMDIIQPFVILILEFFKQLILFIQKLIDYPYGFYERRN